MGCVWGCCCPGLNVTVNTKMPFCWHVLTKAGFCSPALGLGMSCLCFSCTQPVLPVPSHPCSLWPSHLQPQLGRPQSHSFFLPCFALCFPLAHPTPVHTSLHPSLSVSFCPHPGCLLSAFLTASAQPCWKPALGKNQPGTAAMGASMGSGPPGSHLVSPGLSWPQGRDPPAEGQE